MKDGQATYVARYVRTSRLQQEESFGAPKFNKVTKTLHHLVYSYVRNASYVDGSMELNNEHTHGLCLHQA